MSTKSSNMEQLVLDLGKDICLCLFFRLNLPRLYSASASVSRSTDVTSADLVSAKGKTKEMYCCYIVLIVLF